MESIVAGVGGKAVMEPLVVASLFSSDTEIGINCVLLDVTGLSMLCKLARQDCSVKNISVGSYCVCIV